MSGIMEVDEFTVESGDTVEVGDDLTIRSDGAVTLDGDLVAGSSAGQSITIEAGGPVTINGTIRSGAGAAGQDGGALTIYAPGQTVTLGDGAKLQSGNGSGGVSTTSDLYRSLTDRTGVDASSGMSGGGIYIYAATLVVPETTGVIRLGNGGTGAAVTVEGEDLLTYEIPDDFGNGGGDSGFLYIEADEVIGLGYEVTVLEEDLLDEETGEIYAPTWTTLQLITPQDGQIAGGVGGNAGAIYYGLNADGESTWPEEAEEDVLSRDTTKDGGFYLAGSVGGDSYSEGEGGTGADVNMAESRYTDTLARGGRGGNCGGFVSAPYGGQVLVGNSRCTVGRGGHATAVGRNGADGEHPSGNGVDAGEAWAYGGTGGKKVMKLANGKFTFGIAGIGGNATAKGGNGGRGGGLCPGNVAAKGGNGGDGGFAEATAGNYNQNVDVSLMGTAAAVGGQAGQSGDGLSEPGDAGSYGDSTTYGRAGCLTIDGVTGPVGEVCGATTTTTTTSTTTTAAPCTCTSDDLGVTYNILYYSGAVGWSDCGVRSAWESLRHNAGLAEDYLFTNGDYLPLGYDSSAPSLTGDCAMSINCPSGPVTD